MLRGMTLFRCHECGKIFKDFDIEWNATVFSTPMPCPKCGKEHTYPLRNLITGSWTYKKIWELNDKMKEESGRRGIRTPGTVTGTTV